VSSEFIASVVGSSGARDPHIPGVKGLYRNLQEPLTFPEVLFLRITPRRASAEILGTA